MEDGVGHRLLRAAKQRMRLVEVQPGAQVATLLDGLKTSNEADPNYLGTELKSASDEYARAVRELEWT